MAEPLPDAAITAAAIQHAEYRGFTDPDERDIAITGDMLEAAAPALRAQGAATEREACALLMEREGLPTMAWLLRKDGSDA